jgi:hypothetical protein
MQRQMGSVAADEDHDLPPVGMFGPNGRPTGELGLFLWGRTGSDVVVRQVF